mgnify:CR=1 FL=1
MSTGQWLVLAWLRWPGLACSVWHAQSERQEAKERTGPVGDTQCMPLGSKRRNHSYVHEQECQLFVC